MSVAVTYKGTVIAEMEESGTKTLKTGGTYCEGDITVEHTAGATNCKIYEVTLAKSSGWVKLLDLDDDVLAHINDPGLVVSLVNMSGYAYEYYTNAMMTASNTAVSVTGDYPVYGIAIHQYSETNYKGIGIFYTPSDTTTDKSLGNARFRLGGRAYYYLPTDGFIRSGTYRLTFTW